MKLDGIQEALTKGSKLHTFRSGGGLRVVLIEKGSKLLGYGEAPDVDEALRHTEIDVTVGHESYEAQYSGKKARHTHYLTGSSATSSGLDAWIAQGRTFDATFKDGFFVVELFGTEMYKPSDSVFEEAARTGEPVKTVGPHGWTFITEAKDFQTHGTRVDEAAPKGKGSPWFYKVKKTARAATLSEAIQKALEAPVEIQNDPHA